MRKKKPTNTLSKCKKTKERKRLLLNWTEDKNYDWYTGMAKAFSTLLKLPYIEKYILNIDHQKNPKSI